MCHRDFVLVRKSVGKPFAGLAGDFAGKLGTRNFDGFDIPRLGGFLQTKTEDVVAVLLKFFSFWPITVVASWNVGDIGLKGWT